MTRKLRQDTATEMKEVEVIEGVPAPSQLKPYVHFMDQHDLSELLLEVEPEQGAAIKIQLKRASAAVEWIEKIPANSKESSTPHVPTAPVSEAQTRAKVVSSPLVGTFYSRPSPNSSAYVDVGTSVRAGQTLCIVEAMKLMNEIESEFSGKILKILVEDGAPVEFGEPLFEIECN